MDFAPLWAQASPIPLHAVLAMAAVVVGGMQFVLPKGTPLHRAVGYAWVAMMTVVAGSSFFIHKLNVIGPFSPIHLLSVLTLGSLWFAIRAARNGNIARHRTIMLSLYIFALIVTGAFTLLPGCAMHAVVFGG